jgi:hypothetical protein
MVLDPILYIKALSACVRLSVRDATVPRFNPLAEPAAREAVTRTNGPGPAKTGEGLTGCDGGQQGRAGHGRVPAGPVRAGHGRGADCACVRLSDTTVPRFNSPAEPARTVGFGKRDSARTVGFGKRDSARTVGFGNQAASTRAHGTWFSGLGISTLGPGKFQDMVFRTWDLIFGAWIFTLAVSKTET